MKQTPAQRHAVLVIEDEPGVIWGVRQLLEREGLLVEAASSGAEALEKLKHREFSLALVDAKLPDADGIRLAEEIRVRTGMTMILLSAFYHDDDPTVGRMLRAGLFAGFVKKPFQHGTVISLVKRVLTSSSKYTTRPQISCNLSES